MSANVIKQLLSHTNLKCFSAVNNSILKRSIRNYAGHVIHDFRTDTIKSYLY